MTQMKFVKPEDKEYYEERNILENLKPITLTEIVEAKLKTDLYLESDYERMVDKIDNVTSLLHAVISALGEDQQIKVARNLGYIVDDSHLEIYIAPNGIKHKKLRRRE